MNIDAIPAELRHLDQWLIWRYQQRPGQTKPTKVPYRALDPHRKASSTDPASWARYQDAIDSAATADGIGFVFTPDDPYCGIDLDGFDQQEHMRIVRLFDSYTEHSVSGGLHIILNGQLPGSGRHPADFGVFDRGRYFVVTGNHLEGTPATVTDRQPELDEFLELYLPPLPEPTPPRPTQPISLNDQQLLEKAFAARNGHDFQRLYHGDTTDHQSASEADLALCRTAAFWTGRDPHRIDTWMRNSGLMRDKWERPDYRERTIELAIATTNDVYTPAAQPRAPSDTNGNNPAPDPTNTVEIVVQTLEAFVAVEEPGATAILGTADNAVIPQGGDAMVYGDGGVGKTTLCVDLACHLAAGDDWLDLTVPQPVRVLLIENEGPRPLFRRKLERKLAGWKGSPIEGRVEILEQPWGELDLVSTAWREALARTIAERKIDVVLVGPLTSIGMEGAGTIAEARAFLALVESVRAQSGRPIAIIIVHHENKGGKVSGAWEGAGDTLIHVTQLGHAQLRLYFQKARWASEQHATTLQLAWAPGDSFALTAEQNENRAETTWSTLEDFVLRNPGCTWKTVTTTRNEDGTKVVRGQLEYLARRRDQMLEEGVIINTGTGGAFELWHRDDPARPQGIDDDETYSH